MAGPPARDAVAVAERLLAIQAQDPRGARLAVRARSRGLSVANIDRALTEERALLITWLNRGTLHLVRSEDYPWLQALTTPPLRTGNARRLAGEGISPGTAERGITTIARALSSEGPLNRDQLRDRLATAGVSTRGQALVHLLVRASLDGLVVRGPMVAGKHAFVLVRDWLGAPKRIERDRALAELARRYLAGHGPADDRDLARWTGLPLRDARAGLEAIAPKLHERDDGLVELRRRPSPAPLPQPRLLGPFEPVLLGWRSRELVVGKYESRIVSGGVFRPFALIRGRAAASWARSGSGIAIDPFGRLSRPERDALEADAKDVARFLAG